MKLKLILTKLPPPPNIHRGPAERAPDITRPDDVGDMSEEQCHHDQDEVVIDMPDAEEQPTRQEEQVPVTTPEHPVPGVNLPRPRRNIRPNSKYSPEVYDLSYVGIKPRLRSRRSIRRTGT